MTSIASTPKQETNMLIVGLGNPGSEYKNTRHNVGFMAIDAIASQYNFTWKTDSKMMGEIASGFIGTQKVILLKPTTFMNLSGQSVSLVKNYYRFETSDIFVIQDEIDIPTGVIKYKIGGGSGGHNGIKSLDSTIGNMYHRIRIGVDKTDDKDMVSDYVLSNFTNSERIVINEKLYDIAKNVGLLVDGKIDEFKAKVV